MLGMEESLQTADMRPVIFGTKKVENELTRSLLFYRSGLTVLSEVP